MLFPLSTIKKFHAEIIFVAWLRDVFVYLFFQGNTSRKFLNLLLFYLPGFWPQISSAFAIIFAECHGLSSVQVRASWQAALFRVLLRGVGFRCVGLTQNISARCKRASHTGSYVYLYFNCLSCNIIDVCFCFHSLSLARSLRFGSRLWKVNIDQNWNSFHHFLFKRTPVTNADKHWWKWQYRYRRYIIIVILKNKFISPSKLKKGSMFCNTRR